jgi:hypothetical protein
MEKATRTNILVVFSLFRVIVARHKPIRGVGAWIDSVAYVMATSLLVAFFSSSAHCKRKSCTTLLSRYCIKFVALFFTCQLHDDEPNLLKQQVVRSY